MSKPFYEQPILNSPYHVPTRHHALDPQGQPLAQPPFEGRRRSKYLTPVPSSKKKKLTTQGELGLSTQQGEPGTYNENPIVNEIRGHLERWRSLPNPADWGVSPTTQRLLQHWRSHEFQGARPFFCQLEAVETAIWLAEVARGQRRYRALFDHLAEANADANPDLFRIALKLATGAGKTTVMAMLIAWQAINAVRQPGSKLFAKGFLIVAPGITIKDRLRVLNPSEEGSYYDSRELVPPDMMGDLRKARIVVTNYHVFQRRRVLEVNTVGERLMKSRLNDELEVLETEGEMLKRACGELLSIPGVVVINDEAHHCYRERVGAPAEEEGPLDREEAAEAKSNNEAARLWISGIEALARKIDVRAVYDLSATPFFLRGSGYAEGTLFPWVVSDFSLVDAIECGIVKLPRVPVADNAINAAGPVFRNLWDHIGKQMPKKGAGKSGDIDPSSLPTVLESALMQLYGHYEKVSAEWEKAGIRVPPVFIVVCNNTSTSKLVYEWIAGWDREVDGERRFEGNGRLKLFRNWDEHGNPLPRMNTLLIDSAQLESGEALDPSFKTAAALEIERFRQEKMMRDGAASGTVTDADILREVMNTVGREGRLGEHVRCVVSVSMLTEGWDANTVTHVLGVRAFGTQLLCEQVIGRGLRRQSYELGSETDRDGNPLFDVEYADILGIPFDFAAEPQDALPRPPKPITRIHALRERADLAIRFPRIAGYRVELPDDKLTATFTDDSVFTLTPELVGPCKTRIEGLVGEGHDLTPDDLDGMRPSSVALHLTKRLIARKLTVPGQPAPWHLSAKVQPICRAWIKSCLKLVGGTTAGMLTWSEMNDIACEKIHQAIALSMGADGEEHVRAVVDPYNPSGSTDHVLFLTSKTTLWTTAPDKCHVNYVVWDSNWEAEAAKVIEGHPATIAYVKNQGLGFEVPYRFGTQTRRYLPDFIVKLDDGRGRDDPLHLIVEVKGFRDEADKVKASTIRAYWLPGVNRLGDWGRWAFCELREPFAMEEEYGNLVAELTRTNTAHNEKV